MKYTIALLSCCLITSWLLTRQSNGWHSHLTPNLNHNLTLQHLGTKIKITIKTPPFLAYYATCLPHYPWEPDPKVANNIAFMKQRAKEGK